MMSSGHVIAHEIGHVLLGPNAHSTAGLMAASLDLPRIALGGLWFDRIQAAIIRARLACDGSVRVASKGKARDESANRSVQMRGAAARADI